MMEAARTGLAPARVPGIYRWTDCGYLQGYRLQVHFAQTVYRLVDPRGRTLVSGSLDACRQRLSQLAGQHHLQPPQGRVVVLLHGMARNAWSMLSLGRYLHRHWPDTQVILFQYASTSAPVLAHANWLVQFLADVSTASEVHLVGHSLGNIVVRRAFRMVEQGQAQLPPLGRMVMLGPPNGGSQIARNLRGLIPLAWFNGAPFMQVGRDWQQLAAELATPTCPFGIIAGSVPWVPSVHPLVKGPSDLIVSVEETRLEGAADYLIVPVGHAWLMASRRVQAATLNFLQHGRFSA